jgi:aconitate hydratase
VNGQNAHSLGIKGDESFDVKGLETGMKPGQSVTLLVTSPDGTKREVALKLRVDTAIEVEYYKHGGILPYVLRQILQG